MKRTCDYNSGNYLNRIMYNSIIDITLYEHIQIVSEGIEQQLQLNVYTYCFPTAIQCSTQHTPSGDK